MVIGVNAVNSAPGFMLDYYKYAAQDPLSIPNHPEFWNNVLTFYTVVTLVTQCIHEPTNLTSFMCRFSLISRLEASTFLLLVEMLVILLVPQIGSSENVAIGLLMFMAYIGGVGRAYFENTGFAMFGPCPSAMLSGLLIGSALSGVIVSAVQIILLASMSLEYDAIAVQSVIYYSFSSLVILSGGALVVGLLFNPFAKVYIAEFRSRRSVWKNIYRPLGSGGEENQRNDTNELNVEERKCLDDSMTMEKRKNVLLRENIAGDDVLFDDRVITQGEPIVESASIAEKPNGDRTEALESCGSLAVDDRQAALTTSEILQGVPLIPVLRKTWVMMATCFFTFFLTYLLYPGMLLQVNLDDKWYTTNVMAVYNFMDFVGRLVTLWDCFHPSRKVVVIACFARILLVPLLILCATHHISSEAAAYVFTAILGVSNGFVGSLSMLFSPLSPGLSSEGECALASQATGVMILLGCALGSLIQIPEVLLFE